MGTELPPRTPPNDVRHNLPLEVTSFVGREREMAEIRRLLPTTRLLTLTGPGGCGKTRLALRVASDLADTYPDGVWLVELAALADPALVPRATASVFGIPDTGGWAVLDRLVHRLRPKTTLLVLDNCEHLVAAAAELVDTLLRRCPGLHVLATSREPLKSAGETLLRVPSLTVPPGDALPAERLLGYEAVRLFIERALAVRPDFVVTDLNAPFIVEVCRRLDGIPLAIELAAARVRAFSAEQIAARLDDRFRLLTAGPRTAMPRQQTLRATMDWSYALLAEPERTLLRRLSVFASGWTLESAEAVCAGEGIETHALPDLLAHLVEKSLVLAEERQGAMRYRVLETIRQYTRGKLLEAGEEAPTRDRHLACFLRLAEAAEPRLRGHECLIALGQLEQEHDNLRVALEWSLISAQKDVALRLSGALAWFWWLRSHHEEGYRWLERALAAGPDQSAARMKALHGAGWLAHHRRDATTARTLLCESLAIARAQRDRWTVAWVLHLLGRVAYFENDPSTARLLGEESLALAESEGDDWLVAWAVHLLGLAAYIAGDYAMAQAYYARSLAIRRELGYEEGIAILLQLMAFVALREGELGRACALLGEALAFIPRVLGPWSRAMVLAGFTYIAAVSGQPARAARLGAAAAAVVDTYHTPMIPLAEPFLADGLALARQELGEAAFATAVREGQAMSADSAIAEARAIELAPPDRPVSPAHASRVKLTAAEQQVLRLLMTGRTTKEIATELVVAVSTVDRHLTHIYQKLGVRNRAEAVSRALQERLV
jgi:predicted ATPase/DNA-binding CsgD family transcriptional regulator